MGVWQRSGQLSAKSWGLVKEDRELLRFPVRGAVAAAVLGVVLVVPSLVVLAVSDGRAALVVVAVALFLVGLFLVNYVVTLYAAGLVAAADELLHDRPASFADGMARARGLRGPVARWAFVRTVVSVLLGLLRGDGNDGIALTIVRFAAAGIASAAWALISFFTLPVIVLEGLGTVPAMKRSAHIVKERWGDVAVGGVRVSVRAALWWVLPGVVLMVVGAVLALTLANVVAAVAGGIIGGVGLILVVVGSVLAAAARTVFSVALFRYTTEREVVGPFTQAELDGAVTPRKGKRAA